MSNDKQVAKKAKPRPAGAKDVIQMRRGAGSVYLWQDPDMSDELWWKNRKATEFVSDQSVLEMYRMASTALGAIVGVLPILLLKLLGVDVSSNAVIGILEGLLFIGGAFGGAVVGIKSTYKYENKATIKALAKIRESEAGPYTAVLRQSVDGDKLAQLKRLEDAYTTARRRLGGDLLDFETLTRLNDEEKAWTTSAWRGVQAGDNLDQLTRTVDAGVEVSDNIVLEALKKLVPLETVLKHANAEAEKALSRLKVASPRRASDPELRAQALTKWEKIQELYGAYQSDPLEVLTYPALNDPREAPTADFISAYGKTSDLLARKVVDTNELVDAVEAVERTWASAWYHASVTQDKVIPKQERDNVRKAKILLATALNAGASEAERQGAYLKAHELLKGVIVLPKQAVLSIAPPPALPATPNS